MAILAPILPGSIITLNTSGAQSAVRLDVFLQTLYEQKYSRSFFQKLIANGNVLVNERHITKSAYVVHPGQKITLTIPAIPDPEVIRADAYKLPIEIVYRHEQFLILNKPAHILVHTPSTKSTEPTVVDWLLAHFSDIAVIGNSNRPGIIHRLDKDTSGLLMVARNPQAQATLSDLFKNRCISKSYLALVSGHPLPHGTIDCNITRHPTDRIRMTHSSLSGRTAVTHYTVQEFLPNASLLEARPVTGRTHQIRVHCAAIGHPIIGDRLYHHASPLIDRQALHAHKLSFSLHGETFSFCAEPPADFQELLSKLRQEKTSPRTGRNR